MTTTLLHDLDFFDWTQQQAGLLKSRNLAKLDVKHLIQEIESMGASERRELINRLSLLNIPMHKKIFLILSFIRIYRIEL